MYMARWNLSLWQIWHYSKNMCQKGFYTSRKDSNTQTYTGITWYTGELIFDMILHKINTIYPNISEHKPFLEELSLCTYQWRKLIWILQQSKIFYRPFLEERSLCTNQWTKIILWFLHENNLKFLPIKKFIWKNNFLVQIKIIMFLYVFIRRIFESDLIKRKY